MAATHEARTLRGVFSPDELCVISLHPTGTYTSNEQGESWPDVICELVQTEVGDWYAPNYDCAWNGDRDGINVLILASDLPFWRSTAEEIGLCALDYPAAPGRYGDGNWGVVELVPQGPNLAWYE